MLRRIHVVYSLEAPEQSREAVERVHGVHHKSCPVYRSISSAIDITTEYQLRSSAKPA